MIRCLLIDDEPPALAILTSYVDQVPILELVAATTDPIEGLALLQHNRVDVVFLDIQMPKLTGLQFLRLCGPVKVILTTAYTEYALDGFEYDVVDYLLKPISFERFLKAIGKLHTLLPNISLPLDYFFVKGETKSKYLRVRYENLLYVEGLHNHVNLYLSGQRIITYQTLKDMMELLPSPPFLRVHKSYIVSLDHVHSLDGNMLYIGEGVIPVGETYREQLHQFIRPSRLK